MCSWTNRLMMNCRSQNSRTGNTERLTKLVSCRCCRDHSWEGGKWGLSEPQGDSQAVGRCGPPLDHPLSQQTLWARSCVGLAMPWLGRWSPPSTFAAPFSERVSSPWDKTVTTHCTWPVGLTSQTVAAQGAVSVPCPPWGDLTSSYVLTPTQVQNFEEPGTLGASWKNNRTEC